MKHIVITGSTRGIGFALATCFLKQGHNVTINGRSAKGVLKALKGLIAAFGPERVNGYAADVSDINQIEKLYHFAEEGLGKVDIWINNAGMTQSPKYLWDLGSTELDMPIDINVKGTVNGTNVAIRNMIKQKEGYIYNMEGFGSNGRMSEKMTVYGTSKRAVTYFTKSMIKEVENLNNKENLNIKVGILSPGMVFTDLLKNSLHADPENAERVKKVFSILADPASDVAEFLTKAILKNTKNGASIKWLTSRKAMFRFLFSPLRKKRLPEGW